jgi:Fur family ferric uptake transcriptional regulator
VVYWRWTLIAIIRNKDLMSCSAEYAPQLRSLGYRATPQRLAILHVLIHSSRHLSAQEVYSRADQELPGITPATVYRTLEFLKRTGLAWRATRVSGRLTYELAHSRHHHLVCQNCGREGSLDEAAVARAFRRLEATSGFAIDHQHVSLSGLCPSCRAKAAKEGKPGS